tara:strand:+ start:15703 stop:16389 length:687 start_codon:yes stop_codon:yes gene_type:complete
MKYFIIVLSLLLLTGCARTISSGDDVINLEFKISTQGPINTSNTIYLLVFSSTQLILSEEATLDDYFIFPGKNFDDSILATLPDKDINYYYTHYFQYWKQFLYLTNNSIELTTASANSFDASIATIEDHQSIEPSQGFEGIQSIHADTLTITVDITQLGYEESDTVYFSILTFEKDTSSEAGIIKDFLTNDSSHVIDLTKNQLNSGNNSENTSLDTHHDIVQWQYRVY